MNIITFKIFILCSVYCVFGASIKPDVGDSEQSNKISSEFDKLHNDGDDASIQADKSKNQRAVQSPTPVPASPNLKFNNSETATTQNHFTKSTVNVLQKVLENLRNRPISAQLPNKQFLGGKLPGFLERVVQRIQNYFSVYNPPEYFEGSRPPVTSNDGIAVVCSNVENENLSCNPVPPEEYGVLQEECENAVSSANNPPQSETPINTEDGYNIVVTHTVVHDNLINLYSPVADPSAGTSQVVSNVVVILEPSAAEYTPPSTQTPVRNKDKFYVYVNPTAANKKKNQLQTKADTSEKPETFQPYDNATYTVIIKGNKLQEYSNNIENTDNGELHPEISAYIQTLTDTKGNEEPALNSRSVQPNKMADVPNINLVLIPPDEKTNKSCGIDKYENANIEYYILKPDNGHAIKPKNSTNNSNTYSLQKTEIDATSATYLPPEQPVSNEQYQTVEATSVNGGQQSTNKYPLLFNLFNKKPEEPRTS